MARTRRPADVARRAILEAAAKRLREGGPEAVRLQDVAGDLGLSHPAILHHFGSREGLMQALAEHVLASLEAELIAGLSRATSEAGAEQIVLRAFDVVADEGHAQLLAWRALADAGEPRAAGRARPTLLGAIAERVHARRCEHARGLRLAPPPREDSEFLVRLASAAMLGEGIGAGVFDRSFGRGADGAARRRFRAWFARLLVAHDGLSPRRAGAPGSRRGGSARPRGRGRPSPR